MADPAAPEGALTVADWADFRLATEFTTALPGDSGVPHVSRLTPGVCWAAAMPEMPPDPVLRAWNAPLAEELGLPAVATPDATRAAAALFSGGRPVAGSVPYAMRYGGHQFGNWAGQLGDGRVINLGEWMTPQGAAHTLQLKGAGRTPYSRGADGRAVLRSSIREYVLSEAMHALGVPTSRALALVTTGHAVERDMLYDGNAALEPGAIVTRVAPNFIRLGNFEIHAAQDEIGLLQQLFDFCIARDYPELERDPLALYAEVCGRTAELMAHWTALGFVHGVMNTDNLSILGLTIDYGPFGWLEPFDPSWTANDVDTGRRYCYGRQPQMAQWNLSRFGSALARLGVPVADLEAVLRDYTDRYNARFQSHMAAKLGLPALESADQEWLGALFEWLQADQLDMTILFRGLVECRNVAPGVPADAVFARAWAAASYAVEGAPVSEAALAWFRGWQERQGASSLSAEDAARRMRAANPVFVPRNWRLAQAIEAAEANDWSSLDALLQRVQSPYTGDFEEAVAQKRPQWAVNRPGCGRLTCSS